MIPTVLPFSDFPNVCAPVRRSLAQDRLVVKSRPSERLISSVLVPVCTMSGVLCCLRHAQDRVVEDHLRENDHHLVVLGRREARGALHGQDVTDASTS